MSFRTLLGQPNFRWLWIGQICSQLGDRLTQMILIAIVGARAPGSTLALSTMMAWTVIPAFVVSPLAGACVDRWDRRRTMLVCDLARGAVVLTLPILAAKAAMAPTYLLVFLLFAIACFFLPARLALMPALVDARTLVAANSLMTTSGMIGATTSMLAGGLLVEHWGVAASCGMAAASYLASAACVLGVRPPPAPAPPPPPRSLTLFSEIREGVVYAFGQPHAQFVLGVLFLLTGASGAIFVVATVIVQQALGSVTRDLGIYSVTVGLGLFLGTVAYGRLGQRWHKPSMILWCLTTSGLCLLGFAWGVGGQHLRWAGWVATVALGLVVAPIGSAVNAMIHELVQGRLWGRVFSAMGIVMNAALLLGLWGAGVAAERITPLGTLVVVSGFLVLAGLVGLLRARGRRVVL